MDQSTVIWYYSYDNEQCSCASHWLQANSPERLTKPFDSFSLWHQWYPTAALHFSAVSGWCHRWWWEVAMSLGKLYSLAAVSSLRTYLWECLLLIPQSVWLEASWSNRLGPLFPHGYQMTLSSCWLLFSATWEGHGLLAAWSPWAPFTLTPALAFSLLVSPSWAS